MVYPSILKKRSVLAAFFLCAGCSGPTKTPDRGQVVQNEPPTVSSFAYDGVAMVIAEGAILGPWRGLDLPALDVELFREETDPVTDQVIGASASAIISRDQLPPAFAEMLQTPIFVSDGAYCKSTGTFGDEVTLVFHALFEGQSLRTDEDVFRALEKTVPLVVAEVESVCRPSVVSDSKIEHFDLADISVEITDRYHDIDDENADIHIDVNAGGLQLDDDRALVEVERFYTGCDVVEGEGTETELALATNSESGWQIEEIYSVQGSDHWETAVRTKGDLVAVSGTGLYRNKKFISIFPPLEVREPCDPTEEDAD